MLKNFLQFIHDKKLFQKEEKILLAVSGGLDSVLMAALFKKAKLNYAIAHCNFSLRGKESDGDELFVKNIAQKHNVYFHSTHFDTKNFAKKNKLSIQEAARKLRYNWFDQLCTEYGYVHIATAHHLNDSIETFFINLLRGTGLQGLSGIPVVNGNIIRPLLFATHDEILSFAKKKKLKYREDSSNASDYYLRNKIRHHLIPVLKDIQPDLEVCMQTAFDHIAFANAFFKSRLDEWKEKFVQTDAENKIHIPLAKLNENAEPAVFLSSLLHSYKITDVDCAKITGTKSSGKKFISKNYRILRNRQELILDLKIPGTDEMISISKSEKNIPFSQGNLQLILEKKSAHFPLPSSSNIHVLDADLLLFPLTLRNWKTGDFFYPLGMKNRKKLSDFFVDQKFSLFEKENCRLLLSGNNIVCILGHRIDDRFKITPETKNIFRIELSPV